MTTRANHPSAVPPGLLRGMAVALLPALAIWGVVIWSLWG